MQRKQRKWLFSKYNLSTAATATSSGPLLYYCDDLEENDALCQQQAAVWRFQNQRELIPRTNKDFTKN